MAFQKLDWTPVDVAKFTGDLQKTYKAMLDSRAKFEASATAAVKAKGLVPDGMVVIWAHKRGSAFATKPGKTGVAKDTLTL